MIVINGTVSEETKQHLLAGGTHPVARRHANLIIAGGNAASSLPSGYKRVEYIESNGTQYIDTGFVPNQDTRLAMKVTFPIAGTNMFLFGVRAGEKLNTFSFNAYTSGVYRSHYNTEWLDFDPGVSFAKPFTIDKNKNVTTLNGTHTVKGIYAAFKCPGNLVLFGINSSGTVGTFATAKLYSCKIYDNGTLVRNFVPCISVNRKIGLYDLVGQKFYDNKGTGSFIAP